MNVSYKNLLMLAAMRLLAEEALTEEQMPDFEAAMEFTNSEDFKEAMESSSDIDDSESLGCFINIIENIEDEINGR